MRERRRWGGGGYRINTTRFIPHSLSFECSVLCSPTRSHFFAAPLHPFPSSSTTLLLSSLSRNFSFPFKTVFLFFTPNPFFLRLLLFFSFPSFSSFLTVFRFFSLLFFYSSPNILTLFLPLSLMFSNYFSPFVCHFPFFLLTLFLFFSNYFSIFSTSFPILLQPFFPFYILKITISTSSSILFFPYFFPPLPYLVMYLFSYLLLLWYLPFFLSFPNYFSL